MPMDDLSEQQRLLRDSVRKFASHELTPNAAKWDRDCNLTDAIVYKLGAMGCSA